LAKKGRGPQPSVFVPKNPQKYRGRGQIILRSNHERYYAAMLDQRVDVIQWTSEPKEFGIHYPDPKKNGAMSVYWPDFLVLLLTEDKQIKTLLVELKPVEQTFLEAARTEEQKREVARNYSKWAAAMAFCERRGWEFVVRCENDTYGSLGKPLGKLSGQFLHKSMITKVKRTAVKPKVAKKNVVKAAKKPGPPKRPVRPARPARPSRRP